MLSTILKVKDATTFATSPGNAFRKKQRLRLLLCVNMDGSDKCNSLIIGKTENPRCFEVVEKLSAQYVSSTKAWMSRAIFSEWLKSFDGNMGWLPKEESVPAVGQLHGAPHPGASPEECGVAVLSPNGTSVIHP